MNTFNKKSLFVALASLGALSVTGTADAVYVNPDGTGQVLLYPYYTVRNKVAGVVSPFNSLLSVVNSTVSAKIVKVRFLEGKNSREVLDFNLYLSAKDVWTVAIIPVGDGAGIFTTDTSCTTPKVASSAATANAFVNFAYSGDPAGGSLDRTTEGYVEIIEMGALLKNSSTEFWVTHVAGVPRDCTAITSAQSASDITFPTGGLFGGITLVNVLAGEDITADAVALEQFASDSLWAIPGSILPNLTQADPQWTVFTSAVGGGTVSGTTVRGIDSVSAVLMHRNVMNEFVLDTPTASQTSWVVTFPTKRYYYNEAAGQLCGTSQVPCNQVESLFQRNFVAAGACDDVGLVAWSREEQKPSTPGGFSPPPPSGAVPALCWEANVVTFNSKNVFGSANTSNVNTAYQNGWMDLDLLGGLTSGKHKLPTSSGTFTGLPVIGFAAQTFNNGTLLDPAGKLIQSQYGGNFVHKYSPGIFNP